VTFLAGTCGNAMAKDGFNCLAGMCSHDGSDVRGQSGTITAVVNARAWREW
jgi:hypothetical protein